MCEYAVLGGIENGIDIELIYPFIQDARSICEIGAGYGRILQYLIKKGYQGEITGIERSQQFFSYLKSQYQERVNLICVDIMNCHFVQQYDVALWMWSNLSEWPPHQQFNYLKKLTRWVKPGGIFVMETIDAEQRPLNSTTYREQFYCHTGQHGVTFGYNASHEEIDHYLLQLNLKRNKYPWVKPHGIR